LHGFLWQAPGPDVDLTTPFPPFASGLKLFGAFYINDLGEILPPERYQTAIIAPCI